MRVTVTKVQIPAWSTLGFGWGTNEQGKTVQFAGDHRPLRDIGEAIRSARSEADLPVAIVDDRQLTLVSRS